MRGVKVTGIDVQGVTPGEARGGEGRRGGGRLGGDAVFSHSLRHDCSFKNHGDDDNLGVREGCGGGVRVGLEV